MELEAEQQRLKTQLNHERALREREELRQLIDEAAKHLQEMLVQSLLVSRAVKDLDQNGSSTVENLRNADAEMFAQVREADVIHHRLGLRLGFDHPVTSGFNAARDGYMALSQYIDSLPPVTTATKETISKHQDAAVKGAGEFSGAAHLITRSQLT